jgi:ATP-dependent helicase HepA
MLSATPVQVHSDDLFALLHLLRPDLFPDKSVFQAVLEPNRHLTNAARILRSGQTAGADWLTDAARAVAKAGETDWGRTALRSDPRYRDVVDRLSDHELDHEGRVGCIHDLEELHSLAHVMNRTRRRDIGRFTIRDPQTVQVQFTPEQQEVYDTVLAFRQEVLLQDHDPQIVRLILSTLERQAVSSINALRRTLDRILASGGISVADLTDDPDAEDPLTSLPAAVLERARELLAAVRDLPEEDPKFDRLFEIVSQTVADAEGPGKVLVFSSFLNTIDYLERRLTAGGLRAGIVTGRVADDEREDLRNRFRLDRNEEDAVDVLLSSEVGCEGLDYEFCDRLVNYDIPWNPMRIEQRIGRIDRFGQRSDKVLIFNFITADTVEERVFFRCFERLGVFRDTVGDLEEVLGEVAHDLNRVALDPVLSPEQVESRARQVADNAIRLAEEQRRLDTESGDLLGLDDAFVAEVDDIMQGGRYVREEDLRILIETFLRQPALRGSLDDVEGDKIQRLRLNDGGRRELMSRIGRLTPAGHTARSFQRALEATDEVPLTFHQGTAVERRDIEFLTPVHPLARAAAAHWMQQNRALVGAFRVATDCVPPGMYVFACEVWETIAARPDLRLVCLAISAHDRAYADVLSNEFLSLLASARKRGGEDTGLAPASTAQCLRELDAISDARRRDAVRRLEASNEPLLNRRLASLDSLHESRRQRVQAELEAATHPRIVRMKQAELSGIVADYEQRRVELERRRQVDILSRRVATGLMEIVNAR